MGIGKKIKKYVTSWKCRGYEKDIPDEVPAELTSLNLAPSYKAIAIAILKNDHNLISLGFSATRSKYYDYYKKIEIEKRKMI